MKLADIMWIIRQRWPYNGKIMRVMEGYRALGTQHRLTLTDIALRNHVFAASPHAVDLYAAGLAEGRRQCALEIFRLASTDTAVLFSLIETKPPQGAK